MSFSPDAKEDGEKRLDATSGLCLEWRDIRYDVELSGAALKESRSAASTTKTILHGISAVAPSNGLMAIMVRVRFDS